MKIIEVADGNCEGGIAKDLSLQIVRRGEELGGGGAEEGVGVTVAFAGSRVSAGDQVSAGGGERSNALLELLAASSGEKRLWGTLVEGLRDLGKEGFGFGSLRDQDEIGAGAELTGAREAAVD